MIEFCWKRLLKKHFLKVLNFHKYPGFTWAEFLLILLWSNFQRVKEDVMKLEKRGVLQFSGGNWTEASICVLFYCERVAGKKYNKYKINSPVNWFYKWSGVKWWGEDFTMIIHNRNNCQWLSSWEHDVDLEVVYCGCWSTRTLLYFPLSVCSFSSVRPSQT